MLFVREKFERVIKQCNQWWPSFINDDGPEVKKTKPQKVQQKQLKAEAELKAKNEIHSLTANSSTVSHYRGLTGTVTCQPYLNWNVPSTQVSTWVSLTGAIIPRILIKNLFHSFTLQWYRHVKFKLTHKYTNFNTVSSVRQFDSLPQLLTVPRYSLQDNEAHLFLISQQMTCSNTFYVPSVIMTLM